MLSLDSTVEEFSARRRKVQDEWLAIIEPQARRGWTHALEETLTEMWRDIYADEAGQETSRTYDLSALEKAFKRGDPATDSRALALLLVTAIMNSATVEAARDDDAEVFLEWVSMSDGAVRETHQEAHGQVRPVGEMFDVGESKMPWPGSPFGSVSEWINCRCVVRPTLASEFASTGATLTAGGIMTDTAPRPEGIGVPWYGPLAPEGVWSGDKRKFASGSLTTRPLPLPITWQKQSDEGHAGNVTVAMAEETFRDEDTGLLWGTGHFLLTSAEADETVGLLAEFGRFGISVDADSSTFEVDEDAGGVVFTEARVCSACIVPIPAFAEAWIALGEMPEDIRKKMRPRDERDPQEDAEEKGQKPEGTDVPEPEMIRPDAPKPDDLDEDPKKKKLPFREVDTAERDRLKDDNKALPDGSFPIANKDDLGNAIQAIGRAKDPDKAKAHIKRRAKDLGAEAMIPDTWAVQKVGFYENDGRVEFVDVAPGRTEDGPGWITNPVDTDRLRDYWVHGAGAAKIGWGSPGDFNRCRAAVAEYVKPQHLNGYCANRHFDALGFWPGRPVAGETVPFASDTLELQDNTPAPALSLVAGGLGHKAPKAWFQDPKFTAPTPQHIGDDGHIFGHLATWEACHLDGLLTRGECTAPPHTATDYAFMRNRGVVAHDDGSTTPVAQITLGGGHAGPNLSMRAALAHYDESGTAVADIAVGEDEHGIWYNGWIRPGTSEEAVTALRASALSGDWREMPRGSGQLELMAALAVNVPGYGIPRTRVGMDDIGQVSLVASGIIAPSAESREQVQEDLEVMGIDYDTLAGKIADQMAAKAAEAVEAQARIDALVAEFA